MYTNRKTARVLFWGMRGVFSRVVLAELLNAGVQICGVVSWGGSSSAQERENSSIFSLEPEPINDPSDIIQLAWEHQIPAFGISRLKAVQTRRVLATLGADVACVACFPKRIPAELLDVPPHGFWNVHPSLLPAYRGPVPLFWTFREGVRETAVSIHQMNTRFDTGNILAQTPITLPDGISGPEADQLMANAGGELIVKLLNQLQEGQLLPVPQSGTGSHFSYPEATDFHIPTSWSAQRAFNFMQGVAEWKRPFTIYTPQKILIAHQAINYNAHTTLNQPFIRQNDTLEIQFSPGVLIVK